MTYRQSFSAALFFFFFLSASSVEAGTVNYSYDNNNRLIRTVFSKNNISWQYDKNNNMLYRTAAHQFSWLLFIPVLVQIPTQTQGLVVPENKQLPVAK